MGVARQHGGSRAFTRGHSAHQEAAHKILEAEGFEFDRQSSKTKNIYVHPDGRRIGVNATPRNPSVDLAYIKQAITSSRQEGQVGTRREGTMATQQVPKATTPLVAMADPFLLKKPTTRKGIQARNAALAGWVKRVLERHAPLPVKVLQDAAGELGFNRAQLIKARQAAGVVPFTIVGGGKGLGKGQNPTYVALPHQVPEDASPLGRKHGGEPAGNGVVVAALDPEALALGRLEPTQESPTGPNNGESPETREEPAEGLVGLKPLPKDWTGPGDLERPSESPAKALAAEAPGLPAPPSDGDVTAAAQLLLSTLGLRTLDPEVVSVIQAAQIHARRSLDEAALAHDYIAQALRRVQS